MPVSRLLVRPDHAPVRGLAPADRIGLSVLEPAAARPPASALRDLALGPARAKRWQVQLPVTAAGASASPLAGVSSNADATSS